ncbi:hypothetical protein LWI28_001104 [Acer negundo]|uniref:phytol kinase n=1 Tax=Acer negundo TaxID=4023 RepID=A0AAD5I8Q1_ACENE|nr:hypothetical protein LWI28_001104 [Acer negundo]KAK4835374.1 hypothetical protein QYF36_008950 [Acer negundo]
MTTATTTLLSSSCSFALLRSRPTIIRRYVIPTTTHDHPLRFSSPNRPGLVCREPYYKCRAAITGDLLRDVGATAAVLVGAYGLVRSFDSLTKRNIIQQSLSRKLVHIMSGLLFVVSWPIFSTSMEARYFASFVPLVNCVRLIVHGLSLVKDEGLIKSVTREGKPEELLKGPLYYVLMLMLCAVVFWRESPIGVVSLGMMCAGDGFADIIGRRFGSMKIFYNPKKSWAGSISMFISGFLISSGMLYYYSVLGYFELDWVSTMGRVALVCLVATVVESLPTTHLIDDNISVPLSSMLAAYLSFGY